MPPGKPNSTMDKATGLISLLFDVILPQLQHVQYTHHGLAYVSSSFYWQRQVSIRNNLMWHPCGCAVHSFCSDWIDCRDAFCTVLHL